MDHIFHTSKAMTQSAKNNCMSGVDIRVTRLTMGTTSNKNKVSKKLIISSCYVSRHQVTKTIHVKISCGHRLGALQNAMLATTLRILSRPIDLKRVNAYVRQIHSD
jgi:hypothetical protein